ncbi:MAG: chloramphenicol acetyltransferase [Clostridia bacterium]|nr:chloramphenicol acetyltransferase [Clostridia bacterium]
MKFIDIENWVRKDHYNYFRRLDYPQFNICANLDITKFYKYIQTNDLPYFISILYAATKTANDIKEFRYRIRGDKVVEHETVCPSFTIMTDKEVFGFCTVKHMDDFNDFKTNTSIEIEKTKKNICVEDEPGRDDYIFVTSIPWVSFTGMTHPIHTNPVDSIPKISWGKHFEENGKMKLPFSVQSHHALIDGMHVGQYFETIQEMLDHPENFK